VLGIDDWAWRKGRRYGSILVDLERHRPVDLLEEYSVTAIAAWLRRHRSVRLIVRDRSPVGRKACQQGAPQARQVADRFHLLLNLTDQLAKGLQHHPKPRSRLPTGSVPSPAEEVMCPPLPQKAECFAQMLHLRAQGWSHRAIAQVVGVSYKTVERWLRYGAPPASGGTVVLHHPQRGQASQCSPLKPRQAAWLFVQVAEDLPEKERQPLEHLLEDRPDLVPLYQLAQRFVRLLAQRDSQALLPWLQEAQQAAWSEVRQLARGLLADYAAVQAALELPYSNGPVEGQVTRLKLLKRQMYGRAKLPLLRARFLPAA
jgi:transposase